MDTIAYIGRHWGDPSTVVYDSYEYAAVPASVLEIANTMAIEAYINNDARYDRVVYPRFAHQMRESELVRLSAC